LISKKTHPKEEVVGNYFNRRIIMASMVILGQFFSFSFKVMKNYDFDAYKKIFVKQMAFICQISKFC